MADYRYEINGRVYVQRELVLAQVQELLAALSGITLTELTVTGILSSAGDRVYGLLAIVLIPEGKTARQRDMAMAEEDLRDAPASMVVRMVADFFVCTQPSSLLGELGRLISLAGAAAMPSNNWSACSPTETSASAA